MLIQHQHHVRTLCYALCVFLLTDCAPEAPSEGVYYWRTEWRLDNREEATLLSYNMDRIYVRLFDLDYDFAQSKTLPRGPLQFPTNLHPTYGGDPYPSRRGLSLVPVIFIVNRVWQHERDPAGLAEQLSQSLDRFATNDPELLAGKHLQIDCDWTPSTREAYFTFLRALQHIRPEWTLSATVRLHQYRERTQNGVPPVDKGLLMCYNMAPVGDPTTRDAIYDEALLTGYLKAPAYPLPLDAALPIFRWGAAFRAGEFLGLTEVVTDSTSYVQNSGTNQFQVVRETEVNGLFLRPGDSIRVDGLANAAELRTAKNTLLSRIFVERLLYYDYQNEAQLNRYFTD